MKYGSIIAVCLVVLVCIAVPSVYGDDRTVALTSIVIESFNGDTTTHEWNDGRHQRSFEFSWAMNASRFATKTSDNDGNEINYPISTFVDAWPVALFGFNREGRDLKSFGINGRFDRQGYNWIDIYPVGEDGETPFEIPLPGRVRSLDMWVWGANQNFYIEAYLRDYQGMVHVLRLGNINHAGWRNIGVNVPNHVRQGRRVLPAHAPLQFVKFRLWTQPIEKVDNFFVYFRQFKILTDIFESFFDGDDLADPDLVREFWANSGNSTN